MNASIKLYDGCRTKVPNYNYKCVKIHVDPLTSLFQCIITSDVPRDDVFCLSEEYGRVISMTHISDCIVFFTTKNYMCVIINYCACFVDLSSHQNGIPRLYNYVRAGNTHRLWFIYECDNVSIHEYAIDMNGSRWTTIPMSLFKLCNVRFELRYHQCHV